MQIRRYFTDRQAQAISDVAFRRVSVAADDNSSRFVFAPGNWPLGAIEAFAANALLTHPVPAARRQVYEAGIPPALRGHKALCETDRSHEPVGRLETDVRDAIARVSGGLARHGLDHGYFDSPDDAVMFQEELGAALLQRRMTLSSQVWQQAGVHWAYDVAPARPSRSSELRSYELSSDSFLARITADARRNHNAAALAVGRSYLADATKAIKTALADGGADPAANTALKEALLDAERCGLPAAVAQRVIDECLGGDRSWPEADTHLDADSDVWSLLGAAEPYAVRMTAACGEAGMEELALASFRGEAPRLHFAQADTRHTLDDNRFAGSSAGGDTDPATFTPSAAVDLLSFVLPQPDGADTTPRFDIDGLVHTVRLLTIALDIHVDSATEERGPATDTRAIAIHPLNLASVVMSHGMGYGSDEGRALAATLSALVTGTAAAASAQLAEQLSPCPAFLDLKDAATTFLGNMEDVLLGRGATSATSHYAPAAIYPHSARHGSMLDAARGIVARAKADAAHSGLRNLSLTGLGDDADMAAMLGTESIGLAPVRTLVSHRHLTPDLDAQAIYKVVSPAVPAGLRALHHDDAAIDQILDYMVGRGSLDGAPGVNHGLLRERGVTDDDIEVMESALATAGNIRAVFTPYVLGWDASVTGDDLLSRLGFSDWDVDHANLYCCGALTLEGARDLPVEHLPVFDCDQPLGAIGTRHVSVMDRMRMAQAVQPFITGDLPLDLSMPRDTNIDGIRDLYRRAKGMGLASIRLNREGTTLSAPMDYDDILDALGNHPARDEHFEVTDNIYVRCVETDEACPATDAGSNQAAQLAIAISVGLKYGIPIEAFQDAFTELSPADGSAVLNETLARLAGSFIDPGASRSGAPHSSSAQHAEEQDATGRISRTVHPAPAGREDIQELGSRADASLSDPSQAFGDTAFSPPSVSGPSRKE